MFARTCRTERASRAAVTREELYGTRRIIARGSRAFVRVADPRGRLLLRRAGRGRGRVVVPHPRHAGRPPAVHAVPPRYGALPLVGRPGERHRPAGHRRLVYGGAL